MSQGMHEQRWYRVIYALCRFIRQRAFLLVAPEAEEEKLRWQKNLNQEVKWTKNIHGT